MFCCASMKKVKYQQREKNELSVEEIMKLSEEITAKQLGIGMDRYNYLKTLGSIEILFFLKQQKYDLNDKNVEIFLKKQKKPK